MRLQVIEGLKRRRRESKEVDARALEKELKRSVRGEVRFDDGSRALYSTDASNYRQVPIGVVVPRTVEDVIATVAAARELGAPILGRGGGTSLAGQCCNVAVVMDFSKYLNRILEIDYQEKWARVQPGVVLDDLRDLAEKQHLTFAPDPSTHNHCTLGGMIGNNSCGVHSVMGGSTEDNVIELDVLLYDGTRLTLKETPADELAQIIAAGGRRGEIHSRLHALIAEHEQEIRARFPKIPRRISGYNLPALLPEKSFNLAKAIVGTESTCAIILEAKLRLVHSPPARSLLVIGYRDVYEAGDHIPEVMEAGPTGCEGIDDRLVKLMKAAKIHPEDVKLLPDGNGWLLVEFGGETKEESDAKARRLMKKLEGRVAGMKLFDDKQREKELWKVRESGLGATAREPSGKETWEGWEDSAVPIEQLGKYLRDLRKLFEKFGYGCALYGHFGQGCVHTRIDFDLYTAEGIAKYRRFIGEAAHLVVSHGGSLSGEHGDGQSKAEFLPVMYGDRLVHAFEEFKAIWDPDWKMNPGKIVRPYRIDQNLRLGTDYHPREPETHFQYPGDEFSFAKATRRCVGIGECRKEDGGTMCPSYRATMEEKHSTRGRAHLLFEMLEGDPLKKGFRSDAVKEALDLCLACKGCKSECPVNVDMATYKAEFLSHYYAGHARPRSAYAMGLIHWWARLASIAPRLVNLLGRTRLVKWIGGIDPGRRLPKFASRTFRDWFAARPVVNESSPRVLLWADTFNNYFHPEVAQAAVEVLEHAGYRVVTQEARLCCGRPLYDYGMLDLARHMLLEIVTQLGDEIAAGTPIVGLEPSCVSVFRDELKEMLPSNQDAQRLSKQTYLLSEFLIEKAHYQPPRLSQKAIVHGHCHHKSVLRWNREDELLGKLFTEHEELDAGCCGMAGSFGFEKGKLEISNKIGERKLLPKVREAPSDALILSDGFSCREQMEQGAGRTPLHIAQALQIAIRADKGIPRESTVAARRLAARRFVRVAAGAAAVIGAVALLRAT